MLRVDSIYVRIGGVEILRGVSLNVERGEVVGLVGPNGAGKTTTLKTIMSFHRPERGSVYVDGLDVTRMPPYTRVKHGVSYMPEDLRVFPWLTAEENIRLAVLLSGKMNRYKEILEKVYNVLPEIRRFSDRQSYYLSGGEKRMVALARVLAVEPKYALLDELFEGLAPAIVERLMKALREIAGEGIGILVAESNVILASKLCTRVYYIERGEVIASGTPQEVLAKIAI
jgi:branched-chain amino acid transport system ATP-binding protein